MIRPLFNMNKGFLFSDYYFMEIIFSFSGGDISSPFITNNAKITRVYYKDLKSADNTLLCSIPYNATIANKIKAEKDNNILVTVKDNNDYIFTGYLRKTATFTKTQKNQPINIEVVSAAYLLSCNPDTNYIYEQKTVSQLVTAYLSIVSAVNNITFESDLSAITNNPIISCSTLSKENDIKEEISELLFCYGYTYDFDNSGKFVVLPLFNTPGTITQIFNGENCLTQIKQNVKEETNSKVDVTFDEIGYFPGSLVFSDTTGSNGENKCHQELKPYSYFGDTDSTSEEGDDKSIYCEYDSTYGEVVTVTSITNADILFNSSSGIQKSIINKGTRAQLTIYNGVNATRYINRLDIYGNAYVITSVNVASTGSDSRKTYSYKAKYIHQKSYADDLALKLLNWNRYADYSITLTSKSNFPLGSFCYVTDTGLGQITGRIIQKVENFNSGIINYIIEAISEYTPAEETTIEKVIQGNNDGLIEGIYSTVNTLSEQLGYTFDVSPESSYIPCKSNGEPIDPTNTVSFSAHLYYGTTEITSGITKTMTLNGASVTPTWIDDNNFSLPVDLFTETNNSLKIQWIYNLNVRDVSITVSKLYQGESNNIAYYTFLFLPLL